jgi:hypothetical protein
LPASPFAAQRPTKFEGGTPQTPSLFHQAQENFLATNAQTSAHALRNSEIAAPRSARAIGIAKDTNAEITPSFDTEDRQILRGSATKFSARRRDLIDHFENDGGPFLAIEIQTLVIAISKK